MIWNRLGVVSWPTVVKTHEGKPCWRAQLNRDIESRSGRYTILPQQLSPEHARAAPVPSTANAHRHGHNFYPKLQPAPADVLWPVWASQGR